MLHVVVKSGFEVFVIVVVHGNIARLLLLSSKLRVVDLLAARASATGQDVVCRDGLEVIVPTLLIFIDS